MISMSHSEEDTFNALRRIPFEEMVRIREQSLKTYMNNLGSNIAPFETVINYESHGWTREEFWEYGEAVGLVKIK